MQYQMQDLSLGQEDPLEKEMAAHSNILAWEFPWTEEPGGVQSLGSQNSQTQLRDSRITTRTFFHSFLSYLKNITFLFLNIWYILLTVINIVPISQLDRIVKLNQYQSFWLKQEDQYYMIIFYHFSMRLNISFTTNKE